MGLSHTGMMINKRQRTVQVCLLVVPVFILFQSTSEQVIASNEERMLSIRVGLFYISIKNINLQGQEVKS